MAFLGLPVLTFYRQALANLQEVTASTLKALLVEMECEVLRSWSEKPHKDREWEAPGSAQERRCCPLVQKVPNVRRDY